MHLEKLKASPELIQETIDVLELKSDSEVGSKRNEILTMENLDLLNYMKNYQTCN